MAEPKKYVPKANIRTRNTNFGDVLSLGIHLDEFIKFAKPFVNDRGYVNFNIVPRREPDENSSHSIYLDEYKKGVNRRSDAPSPRKQAAPPAAESNQPPVDDGGDQPPF